MVEGAKLILPHHKEQDAIKYVYDHRESQRLNHDQNLFMAIVWITKKEKRYFSMFLEVLFVDGVEDMNNEERPLCIIIGRDDHGNMQCK